MCQIHICHCIGRGLCIQYAYDGQFDLARRAIESLCNQMEQQGGRTSLPDLYASGRSIRATITRGRNMMPGFGATMRPEGINVLVQLVRSFGRSGGAAP